MILVRVNPSLLPIKTLDKLNNLYIAQKNGPTDVLILDAKQIFGNADFNNPGGLELADYVPSNLDLI